MGLNLLDIALWWLALEIIGFIALPIASYTCRNLKDCGYSVSKPLGLLLLTYISWLLSFPLGYSYFPILLALVIIAACSLAILRLKGLHVDRDYAVRFEALFLVAFVCFAVIRAYSPDIYWTGGEKLMDMTFINSLLRTTQFPPLDPWMSGTAIYYYYFGYLIVANLIKITGIFPSIAFNLATASFFALTLTCAFGIGYNLTEKIKYGFATAFLVTIAGNPAGFFQFLEILFIQKGGIDGILSFNYWTSSRVIPDTINEFPFFSFLQSDVHAHMISITFQLLIILLLLSMIKPGIQGTRYMISVFILGLSIGFLYPLNTWDYPVYLFLAVLVMCFRYLLQRDSFPRSVSSGAGALIAASGAIVVLSYFPYSPYHALYKVERAISVVPSGRTELVYYLAIYGLFLYILYSSAMLSSIKYNIRPVYFIAVLVPLSIISLNLMFELLVMLIPLLILSIISLFKEKDENRMFVLILIITGALLSLFVELFYIRDSLGDTNPVYIRLNTVFKFYLQNWVLWGVSAGAVLFQLREHFSLKKAWGIIAVLMLLMVSVYPVFATAGRTGAFRGEPTLDGEAYVRRDHPQEYAAILWFRNITGQPVVLQAPGELYRWNTYISAFTGLPAVMGWAGHEMNWRPRSEDIGTRWSEVDKMYTSLNLQDVDPLLQKYNISYIYFGEAEARKYSSPRLFDSHPERFERVFGYGDVVVYRVKTLP